MALALRVENVSKQYRIYEHPGDRLKESLTRGRWKAHREFWALRDVSFQIEKGTTTGIIGANGSGKSTLLQIITGTLEPTHGTVHHEGRIAALLELGAGFNPEFTGLENIYLNAALMGFSKSETEARLPEITRFAEIGDFLSQPVKTYSSGMYIRLAFAISVSADPEILIVDEALSVGDAVFQHRCVRRIKEMQERGATILFVSHDPHAIRALCTRAILLNAGQMVSEGNPTDVINRYRQIIMSREAAYKATLPGPLKAEHEDLASLEEDLKPLRFSYRHGDGSAEIVNVELMDAASRAVDVVETGDPILVRVRARLNTDVDDPVCGFLIRNSHGIHVYGTNTEIQQADFGFVRSGEIIEATFTLNCWLGTGQYSITAAIHTAGGISFDWVDDVVLFRVISATVLEGIANLNADVTTRRSRLRAVGVGTDV